MTAPLMVLTVLAVITGYGGETAGHLYGLHDVHFDPLHVSPIGLAGTALAALGIAMAYVLDYRGAGAGLKAACAPVGRFIRAGAVDRSWAFAYAHGLRTLSAGLAWFDRYIIDALINASGAASLSLGERMRAMQTGNVSDYVYAVVVGMLIVTVFSQTWLAGVL